jgi:metallo-beta-lactamase family protein
VRAKIYTINGFSAHAGQTELIDWRRRVGAKRTFLTHGEAPAMDALAKKLDGDVACPQRGDAFEI